MRIELPAIGVLAIFGILSGCSGETPPVSDIAADEHLQFFRSTAWLDDDNNVWNVTLRGWVYEPEDSGVRKAVFEEILESRYDLRVTDAQRANFERRLNLLIADNERNKEIIVEIGDGHFILEPSAENGHFKSTLYFQADDVEALSSGDELSYAAVTAPEEQRNFSGAVRLIEPEGVSVISDIDDTVKISNVTDRKKLLEQTFLFDFEAVPGMAELYSEWASQGASFQFVSSSPWQLYAPLTAFLEQSGFPPSTLNLKAVRFRDDTLFELFKKGTETKPAVIEGILNEYPRRQFILVGDSGEQDPEVYAEIIKKYPDQVLGAYIRNVTSETADNERFAAAFDGIDGERWMLFDNPASIDRNIQ